jgi:hypothetical protein
MEYRHERATIETERYRITGTLTLPQEGYRSRFSDYLNASDREFLAMTDVEIEPLDGPPPERARHEFLAVSKAHIVIAASLGSPD